ncbi:MAG TPA: family 10 glycosylhydrolase [Gemmatimonadaceae bacterium]
MDRPGTRCLLSAILAMALGAPAAHSQATEGVYALTLSNDTDAPPVPREFRGVWIATVGNIDWPSRPGLPVDSAKAELTALLDQAARLRLNAVIFQVRAAADAFYRSPYEPWSVYLTGRSGRAPSPVWDPLTFAVSEAHQRGLELHAWFNPYRARYRGDRGTLSARHVSRTMAAVVKSYGPYLWMDPGEDAVRAHTMKVILDVVRRYDIDGVHIDDYFYPYPERDRRGRAIPFPDAPSWNRYVRNGGKLSREDWRRQNVDLLVESLYREIKREKPWVKFGISPFGIWRPGFPEAVRGLDAFQVLYADSRRWLVEGWLDYFVPQLYWQVRAPQQSYPSLLSWWADQNGRGRHLWPGNGTFRVTDAGALRWPASEVVDQIRVTRDQPGASGNVHFNMTALVRGSDALDQRLLDGPYAKLALVPASPWLSDTSPRAPTVTVTTRPQRLDLRITSTADADRTAAGSTPRWWLVRARYEDGWRAQVIDAAERTVGVPASSGGELPDLVVVNAIDRAGVESKAVRVETAGDGSGGSR